MNDPITNTGVRRITLGLLLGGLLLLAYSVLQLFLVPMAWAAIMAYATWPMYARLRRLLRGRATLSAALMSLLLMASFVLPLLWLVAIMRTELGSAYAAVAAYLAQGPRPLPDFVAAIPWLGFALLTVFFFTLVVSWVDNLIRPMVISSASRTPFLLVMFGVLGGVTAFGLIGLFVGPVILAVLMAVWREWLGQQEPTADSW